MTEEPFDSCYNDQTNGFDNGNGIDNDDKEWCDYDRRRKMNPKMTRMDSDLISLIGQHLREKGLNKTLDCLMKESECLLEHPLAARFRDHILNGQWTEALSVLQKLSPLLSEPNDVEKMRLLILEEKYLELLEEGNMVAALRCLRHELTTYPQFHPEKRIQDLSLYVMCHGRDDLLKTANWSGVNGGSRDKLMDQLQASVMLPPKRLENLMKQSIRLQVDRCPFHFTDEDLSSYSLLTDHMCSRGSFPSEPIHTLKDHSDEVWYVQFSHDGTRLATGCKDGQIYIWNTTISERPKKEKIIKAQPSGITSLKWSPDDSILLSCGAEESAEVIAYNTTTWQEVCKVNHSPEDSLTCCAWNHSGKLFYIGGLKGQFYECSSETGSVTSSWEGVRIHSIATHPSCDLVYAADSHMRIKQYNFHDKTSATLIKEEHPIMSFSLSKDAKYALLNVASQGVHMWNIIDRCLIKRYQGVTQGFYTIHSCFGLSDSFIASGSEDHHVYIWNQRRESPVIILQGHSKTVNCVSWNPAYPTLIASASDDGTVVLWGTEAEMKKWKELDKMESAHNISKESVIIENGLVGGTRTDSEDDDNDEDDDDDEDDDEEGEEREGGVRFISESDLHSLEMLESSSRDEEDSSVEQLEAAVSLSVLSVGLTAMRGESQRRLEAHAMSGPILVMPPRANNHLLNEPPSSSMPLLASQDSMDNSELQSQSFDLDSSIDSTSSRQMESMLISEGNNNSGSGGDVIPANNSVSVIISRNIRTLSDRRQNNEGGGEEVTNSGSSNGSSGPAPPNGSTNTTSTNNETNDTNRSTTTTESSISTVV